MEDTLQALSKFEHWRQIIMDETPKRRVGETVRFLSLECRIDFLAVSPFRRFGVCIRLSHF
jgi:hypothetical protein